MQFSWNSNENTIEDLDGGIIAKAEAFKADLFDK